ncbi:hypothetical protein A9372_07895 [Campylobacter jejuni]|nr:hypothetical protein [Campylobacter jejuni]EEA7714146.1 hypothetical protein [Campylobacter jejuni]EEA7715490.1 hypothetical protein [Campylobacter jejuni]EHD2639875.1 hypothetical protein [Campylobacter jejuni]EHD2641297.1 hypothetical protein [Campylobacter jejuni]
MQMTNLKNLYKDIKNKQMTYCIFNYTHNRIELEIMFDINPEPFKLLIIRKHSNKTLLLDILNGFKLDIFLSKEKYQILLDILDIKGGGTIPFSTKKFFEELNSAIPHQVMQYNLSNNLRYIISQVNNLDEANLVYIKCLIDWSKKENNKHVTEKNRKKTKYLYPDVFEIIKDKNISVVYTNNKDYSKHTNIEDIEVING